MNESGGGTETQTTSPERKLGLAAVLNQLLASLAGATTSEIEAHVRRALAGTGALMGADLAHVLVEAPDDHAFEACFGWSAPGVAVDASLSRFPCGNLFGWLVERLHAGEVVAINGGEDIPDYAEEHRRAFESRRSRATLLVPMRTGTDGRRRALWLRRRRVPGVAPWSGEDHDELRAIADTIVGALDRKRSEEALRSVVEERDQLFDLSIDLIFVLGGFGHVKQWNPAVERTLGWTTTELLGRHVSDLAHADDQERLVELLPVLARRTKETDNVVRLRCADGTHRFVSFDFLRRPGSDLFFGVARDVTESRREDEARKELEAQLRQAQKMEGIGRLAGGIAHDFNNILSVILSYASILSEALPADSPLCGDVTEIETAGRRAADLTRQLLAFSRKQVVRPRVVDLDEAVDRVHKMIGRIVGEDIEVIVERAGGSLPILIDPSFIDQIVLNLVVNARDAMPLGGWLVMETSPLSISGPTARRGVPRGDYAALSVTDSGHGMSAEVQEHLFEPFFTTKKEGMGTGLGLATVYGIVTQAGGYIFVESEVGQGTRFEILFPRAQELVTADASPTKEPARAARAVTILVVDDEPALRRITGRILRAAGYTVIESEGGEAALRETASRNGEVDLLVTDVVMPSMNGRVLAERLRESKPTLPVLYMSGYTDDMLVRNGIRENNEHFLEKPFAPDQLLQAVARAAGQGSAVS